MKVGIYLTFDGNCKEAMEYYRGIFGGDFEMQKTWGESPMDSPEGVQHLMMHVALPLTTGVTLMGCDYYPGMHQDGHTVGNNVEIALTPDSKDDVNRFFDALKLGGAIGQPLQDTFWGSYFGSCKDKFGVKWMFDFPNNTSSGTPDIQPETTGVVGGKSDPINEDSKEERAAKKVKHDTQE
jgi:PhnB protein